MPAVLRRSSKAVTAVREPETTVSPGPFSDPALQCCITELGIDRVMFSIDYPFVENPPGTDWINALSLNAHDKAKILSGNAKRLLKM